MRPGIYDIEAARYYRDDLAGVPTLNATVAKLLIKASPRHAWTAHPRLNDKYAPTVEGKFDLGSAVHEIFLLDNREKIAVVDARDWKTKAAQAVRDQAREEGMIPLLADQWKQVTAMLDALAEQLPGIEADPPMFIGGKPEQTAVWNDHGVMCRARIDYLHDDYSAIDDLKSAGRSAHPSEWTRTTMWGIGADIQYVFNRRAIKALTGITPAFRFAVIETKPPYALSVVDLAPSALALAEAKVDAALERWKRCLDTGIWPAYPPEVYSAEAPGWAETEWWEQQQVEEAAA